MTQRSKRSSTRSFKVGDLVVVYEDDPSARYTGRIVKIWRYEYNDGSTSRPVYHRVYSLVTNSYLEIYKLHDMRKLTKIEEAVLLVHLS